MDLPTLRRSRGMTYELSDDFRLTASDFDFSLECGRTGSGKIRSDQKLFKQSKRLGSARCLKSGALSILNRTYVLLPILKEKVYHKRHLQTDKTAE